MAYVYRVPWKVDLSDIEHRQIRYEYGMRVIVTKEQIDRLSRFYIGEIDMEFKTEEKPKEEPETKYTRDQLEKMKYKELADIAKKMGLKYRKKKLELIEDILANQ